MGQILYFREGAQALSDKDVEACNLSGVFEHTPTWMGVSQGPSGKPGAVFWADAGTPRLKASVTWRKGLRGAFWIGVDADALPTPQELARTQSYPGYGVTLNDDNKWVIPVARIFDGSTALPTRYVLGENGEELEVLPAYRELSRRAGEAFDIMINADAGATVAIPDGRGLAEAALTVNYRVEHDEILMLGLLGEHNYREIVEAMCDFPSMRAMRDALAKKNGQPGLPSSSDGETGTPQDTSQPSQTSQCSQE